MEEELGIEPVEEEVHHEDEAHQATILGARLARKEDGRILIIVKITSRDAHCMDELEIEIPAAFEQGLTQGCAFDPSTLPEDEEHGKQQTMFRIGFANRKHDAWLEKLVFNMDSISRGFGKDPKALDIIARPQSLEEYVHNLHEMLSGVECILLRRDEKVWNVLSANYPKGFLAEYKLMWAKG
jgi:hypothetical protein